MKRRLGTGTIEKTRDGRFRARYPMRPGVRQEVGVFATAAEAAKALDALMYQLTQDEQPKGRTVNQAGARCLDLRERSGYRAVKSERNRWARYIEGAPIGGMALAEVTAGDVRRWVAGLSALRLATQTQRNALNLLRAAFALAVEDGWMPANPCADLSVRHHGTTGETSTFLTADEAHALVMASGCASEVIVALYTGMRQGEQRCLRWEDVSERRITVRFGAPGQATKSGKLRHIPLLPAAAAALASIRGGRTTGLVWPSQGGKHRPKGRMVKVEDWTAWLAAAGLERRVRWHDLRHTCATLLLSGAWGRAWSKEEVQALLGHSSVTVTERYAKSLDATLEDAVMQHYPATSPQPVSRYMPPERRKSQETQGKKVEVRMGFEPTYDGFANRTQGEELREVVASGGLPAGYSDPEATELVSWARGCAAGLTAWDVTDEYAARLDGGE